MRRTLWLAAVVAGSWLTIGPSTAVAAEFELDEVEVVTDQVVYTTGDTIQVQAIYRNRQERQWLWTDALPVRRFQAITNFLPLDDTMTGPLAAAIGLHPIWTPRLGEVMVDANSQVVFAQRTLPEETRLPPGRYFVRLSLRVYDHADPRIGQTLLLAGPSTVIEVVEPQDGDGGNLQTAETPWQTNANGTLRTDLAWNYNMGYQFVPQVDGRITQLGGLFNGTKAVRLYDASGSILALTDVTSSNEWSYGNISPVAVQAGRTYVVAVNLAGSGGAYYQLDNALPQTYGNIRIVQSVYRYNSDLMPTSATTSSMYGQADLEFVPD